MKTNTHSDLSIQWAALIGFDWGDSKHALAIRPMNQPLETLELPHSAESLQTWLDELEKRFGGQPVAVAIEAARGAVVYAMMERPWIHIFAIHPATSSHHRRAFRPSGAKDDAPDALVLLSLLEYHQDRLHRLVADDEATQGLRSLAEARRHAVDRRTRLSNQLISTLKDYFPQALELSGDVISAPLALDFLDKWPCLTDLNLAKPQTIRRFYHAHNVRSSQLIDERLAHIHAAKHLMRIQALIDTKIRIVRLLIAELRVLQEHIDGFEDAIASGFANHPERDLFRGLPGAGANLGPRLLTVFGTDRNRYSSATELQRLSGVAPVTERSGGHCWVHWRWNAPWFLRQTLIEWTGQTIKYCAWSRAYYEQQKAKGQGHWAILRSLAFKWLRILWKCWKANTPYNDELYLKHLEERKSPIAKRARQIAQEMAA